MGKGGKKKAKSGNKNKKVPIDSSKSKSKANTVFKTKTSKANTKTSKKDVAVKDRGECLHFEKGINLEAINEKFKSPLSLKCDDCREDVDDNKPSRKRRGNQSTKNGGGDDKSIWVCLSCGHFSCGGVESPNIPGSHALRHSRIAYQHHHHLAVQLENPQLLWCFRCNTFVNSDTSDKIAIIIKERCPGKHTLDVKEKTPVVSGGSGGTQETCSDGGRLYVVRGMENVGNTCFLNSVMQCLLALDRFRHHFLNLDASPGSFTCALKKFVVGICEGPDSESAVFDPKEFLKSVCLKAPQFEGNHQQDSQELLLCLRNCLSADHELNAKKKIESGQEDEKSDPSFVEAMFGGQLCNTKTRVVCGHSSIDYEPFSDLSLPIPTTKKPLGTSKPRKSRRNNLISVEDCLSDFFKSEMLTEVNCETCSKLLEEEEEQNKSQNPNEDNPNVTQAGDRVHVIGGESEASDDKKKDSQTVKVKVDTTKKPIIKKAPCVLTIHLKRFLTDAQGHSNKLDGHVKFNRTLDLKPYIDQSAEKDECKYRLVGVVEHIGTTLRYGHYVAYIRAKGTKKSTKSNVDGENDYVWYKANDDRVRECSLDQVLCSKAYILFYERV